MEKKYELSDEAKQRKAEYIKRYKDEHYKYFSFKVRLDGDEDLLNLLNSSANKSELVKDALREWLKNHK